MAQPAANQDQHLATLAEHDRIRRSTEMPVFRGTSSKDMSARDWMDRFEGAAIIAKWETDERKIVEFRQLLRDEALAWWKGIQNFADVRDLKKWDIVKEEFLSAYDKKGTAKNICSNFKDLYQKPKETVRDFYSRVAAIFTKMKEVRPAEMADPRCEEDEDDAAQARRYRTCKVEGLDDMTKYIQTQMFLAGLHEKIRSKVLESGKTTPYDIYKKAVEIETIEEDKKVKATPTVTAVSYENTEPAANAATEVDDMDEDELQAVNAIRAQKGKAPFRRSGPNGGAPKPIQCRYCNKWGHMQKICKARQRDKAPMVGADGKPYTNKAPAGPGAQKNFAVHGLEKPEPEVVGYVGPSVARIQAPSDFASVIDHLNW